MPNTNADTDTNTNTNANANSCASSNSLYVNTMQCQTNMINQAILKNLGISNLIVNTLYLLNHQRDNCPLRYLGVISLVLLKSVSSFHFAYNIALSQTLDLKLDLGCQLKIKQEKALLYQMVLFSQLCLS